MEQAYEQPAASRPPGSTQTTSPSQRRGLWKAIATFVGQRLLFGIFVLLAIIYITYFVFLVAQGAEVATALSLAASQTFNYVRNLLQGELGTTQPGSAAFQAQPILEILPTALLRSLGLLAATFGLAVVLGVPLGIWAAYHRHSRGSLVILIVSFVGISTPVFFAALFLQIVAIELTEAYGQTIVPVGGFGWDKHLALPVLVLAARPIAQLTRVTFVSVSDILDQDFVRVAQGKGLGRFQILSGHILRNAAIPILTTMVITLRFVLSSLPVVETYFGWGGLGEILLRAMFNQDLNLTLALLLSLGILFILINIALEASYYYIDPRIQPGSSRTGRGRQRGGLLNDLKLLPAELSQAIRDNPLSRLLRNKIAPERIEPSPFKQILDKQEKIDEREAPGGNRGSNWATWRYGILGNFPLLLGTLIVGTLLFLMLFGPRLAPFSPNTTQQLALIDGQMTIPPFAPGERHVWGTDALGRDLYSLIIAGAQQTIILAFGVVIIRVVVGFILGVLAGWFNESWLDRAIMGLVQAIAVFPTLLLAALLIFAIGFERGIITFLIALSVVGWGEITEFVRGEIISIRPQPFVESAIAVGQGTTRLIRVHFLPNLAPGLIAVAAVEVAAVLLILGELGFIGIFIRGGATSDFGLYAQVPEWGSLLSGVRTWVRSYPWTGFYPAAAFFIAILGFNLFGEGLRRLLGRIGLVINSLMSRYTIGIVILLIIGYFWLRTNSGELVFYRQQAKTFDGQNALAHVKALTDPAMDGRALGSDGLMQAADYIQSTFRELGLQPAGESSTYFQADFRTYHALDNQPLLKLDDGGQLPLYRDEFNVYPTASLNLGNTNGEVRFLALMPAALPADLDLSQDIILILSENQLGKLANYNCQAVLIVAPDAVTMKQRYTLSAMAHGSGCGQDTPVLWINERLANRLLKGTGQSVHGLNESLAELEVNDSVDLPTGINATFHIPGIVHSNEPVVNVIGQLPGTSDSLDSQLIIVAAQYDSPPIGPDGVYPGANGNASGVAVLLEAARTLKESGYEPFKTFLFVAYSGEGIPNLAAAPEVTRYLEARTGFDSAYEIEGVIYLRGLGAGGDSIAVWSPGTNNLAKLMETATHLSGMDTERLTATPTINVFVPGHPADQVSDAIPRVGLSRYGWEKTAHQPNDTLTFVSSRNLEEAGEAVSLGLMILGRDENY